jgi:hypothetical protein
LPHAHAVVARRMVLVVLCWSQRGKFKQGPGDPSVPSSCKG